MRNFTRSKFPYLIRYEDHMKDQYVRKCKTIMQGHPKEFGRRVSSLVKDPCAKYVVKLYKTMFTNQ